MLTDFCKLHIYYWRSQSQILHCTHSHHGLGHSGEHSGPERVQQDLALQQDKVQQRGAVLRAQIHQQSAIVCPADMGGERTEDRNELMSSDRERKKNWWIVARRDL